VLAAGLFSTQSPAAKQVLTLLQWMALTLQQPHQQDLSALVR
jgi:hypothetical protein